MGPEATPVNYYSVALIPSGSVSVTCLHSLASDLFIQLSFNNLTLRHSSLACPAASLWFGRTIRTSTGCGKKGKSLEQKGKRGTKLTLRANGTKDLNTSECFLLHFPLLANFISVKGTTINCKVKRLDLILASFTMYSCIYFLSKYCWFNFLNYQLLPP